MTDQSRADLARSFHWHSSYARPSAARQPDAGARPPPFLVDLPGGDEALELPLGLALRRRRTVREYVLRPLELVALGRLLAASYAEHGVRVVNGITIPDRPVPSAGGLYPLDLYVAAQSVDGLPDGAYRYEPRDHRLASTWVGNLHARLAEIAVDQVLLRAANLAIVIAARFRRTMSKYGQRGYRHVLIETGHLAQNLCLAATALDLGTTPIGGFYDGEVAAALGLGLDQDPIYLIAVGQSASGA